VLGIGGFELVEDKFTAVDHDGQQIIEVVRNAAGEPAHRFHFVSTLEFAFKTLARFIRPIMFRTDIAYVKQQGGLTEVFDTARADRDGNRSTISIQTESLEFARTVVKVHKAGTMFGRNELGCVHPDDLFTGHCMKRGRGRIAVQHSACGIFDENRVRATVE
jgi:hypothetical protein